MAGNSAQSFRAAPYDVSMKKRESAPVLDQLVALLTECLTPESARRLLALKADSKLQARVDDLANRHGQGLLTPEEKAEYGGYVYFDTFVAIMKSKARQLLANSLGK
jgi:hypothetical protein